MLINLQLRGLSEIRMSPTVVLFVRRNASSRSFPKEVLRRLRMNGLKARVSFANAKGWRGGSRRERFDIKMLVRSDFHLRGKGRQDLSMSLWHTNVRNPNGRERIEREYCACALCCLNTYIIR